MFNDSFIHFQQKNWLFTRTNWLEELFFSFAAFYIRSVSPSLLRAVASRPYGADDPLPCGFRLERFFDAAVRSRGMGDRWRRLSERRDLRHNRSRHLARKQNNFAFVSPDKIGEHI